MGTVYVGSAPRGLNDKLGESPSIADYGAVVGQDSTSAIIAAAEAAMASPTASRRIYIPQGLYIISAPLPFTNGMEGITFYGDGDSSILQIPKGLALPTGQGFLDFQGGSSGIAFENLALDGNIITPTGLTPSMFNDDETDPVLTANTTIWIHPGASNIQFRNVTIMHTGGYAAYAYANTGNIWGIKFLNCIFKNCRPNLFGSVPTDMNYGAWNGGILIDGDGVNYNVSDVLVSGCHFYRIAGTAFWTHAKALQKLHYGIRVEHCFFEDIGLDAVQMAGVGSGGVDDCDLHRAPGYVTVDDTSPSAPRWGGFQNGTGIDTAGQTQGVNYSNIRIVSPNGGAINLDGFARGNVENCTVMVPLPGEPMYVQDRIALCGPNSDGQNWVQGIFGGNTNNDPIAGTDVTVKGNTLINCGGGAVGAFGSRGWLIDGNNITHPPNANFPPITLGNVGTGPNQRAYNNVVRKNVVKYSPGRNVPVVYEDSQYGAFQAGDKNWVFDNVIIDSTGMAYEFKADPVTSSVTQVTFSSNLGGLGVLDAHFVQRIGQYSASNSALQFYYQGGGVSPAVHMQLSGFSRTGVNNPLLNVSNNGAADTGVFATGNRTQTVFDDCIATGKLVADAFQAMFGYDATGSSYLDAEANLLPAQWGLLRYSYVNNRWEQSVSVSGGARVWSPLISGSGGAPGGAAGDLQFYVDATTFGGSNNLSWNSTTQQLTVTGIGSSSAGIAVSSGFVSSTGGFQTNAALSTAFVASAGGIQVALGVQLGTALYPQTLGTAPTAPPSGYGAFAFQGGSKFWYYNPVTPAWATVDFSATGGGSPGGRAGSVQYNSNPIGTLTGDNNILWDPTNQVLGINALANQSGLTINNGYALSDQGYATGSTSYVAFNGGSGGGALLGGLSVITAGSTGGYIDLPPITYANYPAPLSGLSAFPTVDLLLWVSGVNGTVSVLNNGLNTNGWMNAAGGFVTLNTASNAIQAPSGGVSTRYLTLTTPTPSSIVYPTIIMGTVPSGGLMWGRIYDASSIGAMSISVNAQQSASGPFTADQLNYGAVNVHLGVAAGAPSGTVFSIGVAYPTANPISFNTVFQIGTAGYVGIGGTYTTNYALTVTGAVDIVGPSGQTALLVNGSTTVDGSTGLTALTVTAASGALALNVNGPAAITGTVGQAALTIAVGYITSAGGYVTTLAGTSVFNATAGGMVAAMGFYLGTAITPSGGGMTLPPSGYGALAYDTGSTYYYWNGSGWGTVNLASIGGGGVTSLIAGTGISVNSSTGAVTVTNTGVISLASTGGSSTSVIVSAATGAVTLEVNPNLIVSSLYASGTNYNAISTAGGLCVRTEPNGSGSGVNVNDFVSNGTTVIDNNHTFVGNGGVITNGGMYSSSSNFNALATAGGLAVRTNAAGSAGSGVNVNDLASNGQAVIDNNHTFVGTGGVNVGSVGIRCGGVNIAGSPSDFDGQNWTIVFASAFTISGVGGSYTHLVFKGGVLVSAS